MRGVRKFQRDRRIQEIGEAGLIRLIQKWISKGRSVVRGIGDDCAVFRVSSDRNQLLTIDTLVEDVDFKKDEATPSQIGWKALAINLSDIAAMGGVPKVAVVSLTLPRKTSLRFVKAFYDGIRRLASQFRVAIVGGDLSRGLSISCSIALLGEALPERTIYRTGAKANDLICVTGRLGGSILGRHLTFLPRVREGQFLARAGVSAMIDISDGLIQDLNHLVAARRLAFQLDEARIPIARAALKLARGDASKRLQHALYDGEDFELLFTVGPSRFGKLRKSWKRHFSVPLTAIGRVIPLEKSRKMYRKRLGFEHF